MVATAAVAWAPEPAPAAARDGIATSLHTIDLQPVAAASARSRDTGPALSSHAAAVARRTAPFSLLGVTWTDPAAALGGTVQVRTRARVDGQWSGWRLLETDVPSAADPGTEAGAVRGSTDPLWVGPSDGVEVRVVAATGAPAPRLPAGARVDLIDPGAEPAGTDATAWGSGTAPAPSTTPRAGTQSVQPATGPTAGARAVTLPARPVPRVVSRAGWRADESLNGHEPEYTTDVQTLFVHHTAGTNDYSCADAPKIIRSIHAYHVRSKQWNDVGYNFLVDKCGTLYEGRAGGVALPVLGAHTMGFNTRSAGIAVLGDYAGRGVPGSVKAVIAQVAAYKIGMYGNGTGGTVTMTSAGSNKYRSGAQVRLNRISGHRDAVSTECPGNTLYSQLRSIRDLADEPVTGLGISRLTGAVRVGDTFATKGRVTVAWGVGTPTRMLSRFEILLDGALVAARPNTHRSIALRLSPGVHTLRVRAIPLAGAPATSAARTVVADATAPQFTRPPAVGLRTGSLNGSVPVTLSWRAADEVRLSTVALTRPASRAFGPTVTRWATTARPAVATIWSMRATDRAGNAAVASVTRTPVVVSEAAAGRTGTWGLRRSTGFLGGAALLSATPGASLSWTFTGRSAALGFTRTTTSGQVRVFVDGAQAAVLDLRATATAHRRALFAKSWSTSGNHTVRIEVVGTAGRPTVISDGLVHLN